MGRAGAGVKSGNARVIALRLQSRKTRALCSNSPRSGRRGAWSAPWVVPDPALLLGMRVRTRPVSDRFSRPGTRSCTKSDDSRLASCTVRFRGDPSPKDFPLGLSSIPNSPVPCAGFRPRTSRFHSPRTDFQMLYAFASSTAASTVSRASQSFGRLQNLQCADESIIKRKCKPVG